MDMWRDLRWDAGSRRKPGTTSCERGLNTVLQELNTPISWQDTAPGLEAIFRFLPIVETLNRLVPRLWTIGAIQDLPLGLTVTLHARRNHSPV